MHIYQPNTCGKVESNYGDYPFLLNLLRENPQDKSVIHFVVPNFVHNYTNVSSISLAASKEHPLSRANNLASLSNSSTGARFAIGRGFGVE